MSAPLERAAPVANERPGRSVRRAFVTVRGVGGVLALLSVSVARLGRVALRAFEGGGLTTVQWVVLVLWTVAMAYAEGYKGFQRGFSPNVVARAFQLARAERVSALHAALAPAYCMSLFADTRRRMTVSWSLVVGIAALTQLMRLVPQPWRGIVDAGVVLALAWGTGAIVVFFVRAWATGRVPPVRR